MKPLRFLLLLPFAWDVAFTAEPLAPKQEKLSPEEIGEWLGKIAPETDIDLDLVHRGLISDQFTMRADCARYLAHRGNRESVPYLIDSLSDESAHVGAKYPYAGMSTTRYWANVALVAICKVDQGYRWDDPAAKREEAIARWKIHREILRQEKAEADEFGRKPPGKIDKVLRSANPGSEEAE